MGPKWGLNRIFDAEALRKCLEDLLERSCRPLELKMGPTWDPNRIFDAEALRKPLGGLLERSWRLLEPKKQSWNRSWPLLEASQDRFHQKSGPKWDPNVLWEPSFWRFQVGVQSWTPILWPFKGTLGLSKSIFNAFQEHLWLPK